MKYRIFIFFLGLIKLFVASELKGHPTLVHKWLIKQGYSILKNDKDIDILKSFGSEWLKVLTDMADEDREGEGKKQPDNDGVMWPDYTTTTPGHPIDMDRFNWDYVYTASADICL